MAVCIAFSGFVALAQPTDNPYANYYPGTPASHWTHVLKWQAIHNVTTFGAVPDDGQDDRMAVMAAIDAAATTGGGVVYFPAGTYNFSDSLILRAGVILRGETPAVRDAKDASYRPASKLEFPAYVFDTTANGGLGTDNSTAFKVITCTYDAKNIGVVNLDINRAGIEFHPAFDSLGMVSHPGGTTPNYQPVGDLRNVIVMGVRSNNVAQPHANVPNLTGPNKMRPWQRWYNYFVANIDVYASQNAAICNNRLNDAPTDNFNQPGYKVRNRCTACTNYRNVGQPNNATWNADNFVEVLDGSHAEFDYTAHYGITLNRDKKVIINGRRTIKPYIWYPEPEQEPSLYAKGFVIDDNWLYKTNRVGIWCAGLGLKVRRNVIKDTATNGSTGWATPKNKWLDPNGGEVLRNFSATFENRGIDFGGSDLLFEDNDILVSAANFPESQYGSIDGEGIMDQGNGGGTNPNGLIIRRNKIASSRDDCTNPTIGVYRTMSAHNVLYEDNEFTGNAGCLQIEGDRGQNEFPITNCIMRGNLGVKRLRMIGGYGYNAVVHDNVGRSPGNMDISCFVQEYSNTNLTLQASGCRAINPAAPDTSTYARVRMAAPFDTARFAVAPPVYTFKASIDRGSVDSVVFYLDGFTRLGQGIISPAADTASLDWVPPTIDDVYKVSAEYYTTVNGLRLKLKTAFTTLIVDDGDPATNDPRNIVTSLGHAAPRGGSLQVYPNPGAGRFTLSERNLEVQTAQLLDFTGRVVASRQPAADRSLDFSNMPAGSYMLRCITEREVKVLRVVIR